MVIGKMIKKIYSKLLLMLLSMILIILLIIGYSLAWFNQTNIFYPSIISQELEASAEIYFLDPSNPLVKVYPSYDNYLISDKNLLIIDVVDESNINYINNLCVDIKIKGSIPSLLRIKVYEEFYKYNHIIKINPITKEEEIIEMGGIEKQKLVSYNIFNNLNWFDNREYDGYFYYTLLLEQTAANNELVIPFIRGINNEDNIYPLFINNTPNSSEGYVVSWNIKLDLVQATRAKDIWCLQNFPWE